MNIRLIKIKENADGSADVEVRYDEEGWKFLVEQGLKASLVEAIMQKHTGELYGISDILGTISEESGEGRSHKSVAKIKSGGTD